MGLPMCLRLADAGHDLVAYDTAPGAVDAARHPSVTGAQSPMALRGAEVIVTMLPDGAAVREAVIGSGLARALAAGCLLLDCSSSDPADTAATAEAARGHGVRMVDAPVSGSPAGARAGTLTLLVGGEEGHVSDAAPVLAALGRTHHLGALGAGHAFKALNNLLAAINLAAAGEVLLVGRRLGLDAEVLVRTVNACTGRNDATENKLAQFVLTRGFDSGFRMALMRKDIGIALSLARRAGGPADLGTACARIWDQALAALGPDPDNVEVIRWMESQSGATLGPAGPAQEPGGR